MPCLHGFGFYDDMAKKTFVLSTIYFFTALAQAMFFLSFILSEKLREGVKEYRFIFIIFLIVASLTMCATIVVRFRSEESRERKRWAMIAWANYWFFTTSLMVFLDALL